MSAWQSVGVALVTVSAAVVFYSYVGYPLLLRILPTRASTVETETTQEWPAITIVLPAYNEERVIADTLDSLLQVDYPPDRRQILVVSDASTDRTDEIVRGYADKGVELHRLPTRRGKTAAENASRALIRGEIVVNTDASVRLDRHSLRPLIAAFRDPSVGVASGRDASVGPSGQQSPGESNYVGYEMWVRDLETRVGGIVGASGCFFASRPVLHAAIVPEALSRDFAAPLIAKEHGYRSVSVPDAVCYVPRTASLRREYRRKVRTMTRGLETLFYKRALLNPRKYGMFACMLWSHKLIRWFTPWAAVGLLVGMGAAGVGWPLFGWLLVACLTLAAGSMALAWWWPAGRRMPLAMSAVVYVLYGLVAGLWAWIKALSGELNPVWEPTRREPINVEGEGRRA